MDDRAQRIIERGWYTQGQTFSQAGYAAMLKETGSWKWYIFTTYQSDDYDYSVRIHARDDAAALDCISKEYTLEDIEWSLYERITTLRRIGGTETPDE